MRALIPLHAAGSTTMWRMLTLSLGLALAACSLSGQSIPAYDDTARVKQLLTTLSPWEDGSPDRSNDGRTYGEPNSDRRVFARWFARYIENEVYFQHDKNYRPFPVPSSVAQAIEEQRAWEVEQAQRRAERQQIEGAEEAERRAERQRVFDQQAAQEEAEREVERAASEKADAIEQQRRDAIDAAAAADLACRQRRDDAMYEAGRDPHDPQAAIAKLRATMRCPNDAPAS